jgi:hypothetical protein
MEEFFILPLVIFGLVVLFPTLFSIYMMYKGVKNARTAFIISRTPDTDIVDTRPGFVELKGRVETLGNRFLITPIERKNVVYYHSKVQKYVSSGGPGPGSGHHWSTIWNMSDGVEFLLSDGTAKVKVDPNDANVEISLNDEMEFSSYEMPNILNRFLHSSGFIEPGELGRFSGRLRFIEQYITEGDEVFIIGNAEDRGLERELDRDLEVIPFTIGGLSRKRPFLITDHPEGQFFSLLVLRSLGCFAASMFLLIFPAVWIIMLIIMIG